MRTGTLSYPNRWSGLLTCVFALFIGAPKAHAQDNSTEIAKHQERYEKLETEFTTSQARIISSVGTFEAQQMAYGQLESVGQLLVSMNREFDVLSMSMALASLVTDKRAVPNANRFIELQRGYMTKRTSNSVQYIEKIMPRAKDQETTRLLLEARDLFRSSADLLDRLKSTEEKRK